MYNPVNVKGRGLQMELIEVKEAAEVLGISRQAVYRLIDRGTLAAQWRWGRRLVWDTAVEKLAQDPDFERRSRRRKDA